MAKAQVKDIEVEVEETEETMTPKELAKELEINPKNLRSYLRKEFPRSADEKNTSWKLTEAQIEAARAKFADSEDDEDGDEDEA